jgi:hypothetical protein
MYTNGDSIMKPTKLFGRRESGRRRMGIKWKG